MFKFICLIATAAAIKLNPNQVPHDYGDPAAIAEQHADTMAHAGHIEGIRTSDIAAQEKSDIWRSQGLKQK